MRATLIIAGDFQAEVRPAAPHVGRSTCNTAFHVGPEALDQDALNSFLETHGLVALNTWHGTPKPTQFNQAPQNKVGTSQIDYIITRVSTADPRAKYVKVAKPPIGTWRLHIGHYSLATDVRIMKHFLLPKRRPQHLIYNRQALDDAVRHDTPQAETLRAEIKARVELLEAGSPEINTAILQACCQVFPPAAKVPAQPNGTIQHLWQLRLRATLQYR